MDAEWEPAGHEEEEERDGDERVPPLRPPERAVYQRVTIETPVDWRRFFDFYQAVIKPSAETGAQINLELRLEASGEIDANLVDLSVKESVVQLNPRGKVEVEE